MFRTLNPFKWLRYRSKKPWFDMQTNGKIVDGLVEIKMDWNKAFINELRSLGFHGHNEEEIIQEYMSAFTKKQPDPYLPEDAQEPYSTDHPKLSEGHKFRS